jgi:hypothetical protein
MFGIGAISLGATQLAFGITFDAHRIDDADWMTLLVKMNR